MKKIIVMIGSIIGLLIMLGGLFQFFSWWEYTNEGEILGVPYINKNFLSPFGRLSYDYAETVSSDGGFVQILIALLVIIGNISILIGGLKDKKLAPIIGASVVLLSLVFFLIALNIPIIFSRINNYLVFKSASLDKNVLWGKYSFSMGIPPYSIFSWRLGNGYFIAWVACIISIVGIALKDKEESQTEIKN